MKKQLPLFILLLIAYVITLSIFSKTSPHYVYGDGTEYVLMTESIHNHFSPNIRSKDITKYINYLDKNGLTIQKRKIFEYFYKEIKSAEENPLEYNYEELNRSGYFLADNGNIYCYHFWGYSLLNIPARLILSHLKADIRISFLATNLFIIFWGLWFIMFLKTLQFKHRIILSLLLIFSPSLWYIDWAHAEVFGGVLAFLGTTAYFAEKKYSSLLFFSLASMHYPPLFVPALFVFIVLLLKNKFKIENLTKLFFCSFWIIIPSVFYYYHFGSINLIADTNYLSPEYISFKRLFSFFFDLNQGMILAIPLLLAVFIFFLLKDLFQRKNLRLYPFLICIFVMSLFFMQMSNWNHDHAVANRYVVWNASIIIVLLFFRLINLKNPWFYSLFFLLIISQIAAIFSQQQFNKIYWHSLNFNKVSEYVFDNYPSLYDPEPLIFRYRYNPFELSTTDSVFTYTNKENQITKMMVRKGSIGQLVLRGANKTAVEELDKELDYYLGYAYVNRDDFEAIGYDQSKDTLIPLIEKINEAWMKNNIRANQLTEAAYPILQEKAIAWGVSEDSALKIIVDYEYEYSRESYNKKRAR